MPFYRFLLKAGHQGAGKYAEIEIGTFAPTYTKALELAKKAPMIKHDKSSVVIKSEIIDELDYIVLRIKDRYAKLINGEIDICSLANLYKCKATFSGSYFKTDEAKKIAEFCKRYEKAEDTQKIELEQEYKNWAFEVIRNYDNQQNLTI